MAVKRILAARWWPLSTAWTLLPHTRVHGALLQALLRGSLPVVSLKDHAEDMLGALISRTLEFAPSISAVRRVAQQKGLRLIREPNGDQQPTPLTEASVQQTLGEVVSEVGALEGAELYPKVGRKVARIEA